MNTLLMLHGLIIILHPEFRFLFNLCYNAQGAKKTLSKSSDWTDAKAAWIAAIMAVGVTLTCIFVALPLLKKMAGRHFDA